MNLDTQCGLGLKPQATTTGRWCGNLAVRGFQLRLISSVALARTREALHNAGTRMTPKAQVILHMLRTGLTQRYYDPLQQGINAIEDPRSGLKGQN